MESTMTLSKKALSETLVNPTKESLRRVVKFYDENDEAFYVPDIPIYVAAARFVERLLPARCPVVKKELTDITWSNCPHCHDGKVWDEGLVEVVRQAAINAIDDGSWDSVARAVLAALAQEVGK